MQKQNSFVLWAAIGIAVYFMYSKFSAAQSSDLQKSKNTSGENNLRSMYLDYIKGELAKDISDLKKFMEYERIFNSMPIDDLEASYTYMKDYIAPKRNYQFTPEWNPNSTLAIKINSIKTKYGLFA